MTNYELLALIGEADERYILEARKAAPARKTAEATPVVPVSSEEPAPIPVSMPVSEAADIPAATELFPQQEAVPEEETYAAQETEQPLYEDIPVTPLYSAYAEDAYDSTAALYDEENDTEEDAVYEAGDEERYEEEEEEEYPEEPVRKRSGHKGLRNVLIAACLVLVISCAGSGALLYSLTRGNGEAAPAEMAEVAMTTEDNGATMTMQADPAEPDAEESAPVAEESEEEASPMMQATLQAKAAVPTSPAEWTYDYQVSDSTGAALDSFAYKIASSVFSGTEGNACFSPLSLYHTLSVLASGAGGSTQEEILELLDTEDVDTLAEEVGKSICWNTRNDDAYTMQISNSVWIDEEKENGTPVTFRDDWKTTASERFYADLYSADFDAPETSEALGTWIAEKTGDFLHPTGDSLNLDSDTVMAVLNTVWYRAQWNQSFDSAENTEDTFTTSDGQEVTATFMHQVDSDSRAVQADGYTKSRLFLNSGRIIIVLPDEGVNIEDLLDRYSIAEMFDDATYEEAAVTWSVPKFDTTTTLTNLPEILAEWGVDKAFTTAADFSGMSDTALYVGVLQQGTRIAVDEIGVEAASYTEAGIELASEGSGGLPRVTMNLNRPFLYEVTADDGTPLFMGIVRNPTAG